MRVTANNETADDVTDDEGLHAGQLILDLLPQVNLNIAWGVESKWFCIGFQQ